ncbi:MAG: FlaA1/EpsC-like NDP-sugar epimerase [Maritalea sp.]|jgi:FlaA1/EpsC-like NDP-sugar epimerase
MIKEYFNYLLRLERASKRIVQLTTDIILLSSSFALAMFLRLDGFAFASSTKVWVALLVILPATLLVFIRLGFYRAVIRYISTKAVETIAIGVAFSALTLSAVSQVFELPIPRSVPAIYALLAFVSVGGVRFALRALVERQKFRSKENVIIYGAGESGRQLLTALSNGPDYAVIGFVDDGIDVQGQEVSGVPVHKPSQLATLVKQHGVKTILLALPSANRAAKRLIVDRLENLNVEVRTIPGMADLVSGRASVNDLQVVSVEDLLGRDPVPPQEDLLNLDIAGKRVLVSGAGGSIGSELCRQILRQRPEKLVLFDVSEYALYQIESELLGFLKAQKLEIEIVPIIGSVQNPRRVETVLKRLKVQTVYHAAAYKHVPLVEQNVIEGMRNNIFGTKTISDAAMAAGVENFILISTDKAVRPTNFMGASKRVAELICQGAGKSQNRTKFSMVRFGNVLGSSGSVIPRFREQIEKGGPVTVTHPEINRYFMTIPEAAQLVIQAGAMARGGDVFVLDMGEPVKIVDLAQRMIKLHGLQPFFPNDPHLGSITGDIPITFTGLRKGEKLYEELLIGNSPEGTRHPRIMTANEKLMEKQALEELLSNILAACIAYDAKQIRELLQNAPIEFEPVDDVSDLVWLAATHKPEDSRVVKLQPRGTPRALKE